MPAQIGSQVSVVFINNSVVKIVTVLGKKIWMMFYALCCGGLFRFAKEAEFPAAKGAAFMPCAAWHGTEIPAIGA